MIKNILLSTVLITGLAYSSSVHPDNTEMVTSVATNAEARKVNLDAWNPPLGKIDSGDSCDDGNCLTDLNLCQKDGPMYKVVTSVRDEMKRFFKRF